MSDEDSLWDRFRTWASTLFGGGSDEDYVAGAGEAGQHTVRRTSQKTNRDCGIAALSMMANVPYPRAREALFKPGERCVGTTNARMRAGLTRLGVAHGRFTKFRSWGEIPSHALVHIRWKQLPPADAGHWVVYQKRGSTFRVLDPASFAHTLTAASTENMVPVSFLSVDVVERPKVASKAAPKKSARKRKRTSASTAGRGATSKKPGSTT